MSLRSITAVLDRATLLKSVAGVSFAGLVLDLFGRALGWALFAATVLGVHLDPLLVSFVDPASTLASVVPTLGGIGDVETAIVPMLTALVGVVATTAGAIALLYRLSSYWFVVGTGWRY